MPGCLHVDDIRTQRSRFSREKRGRVKGLGRLYASLFIGGTCLSLVVWVWCLGYREEQVEKKEGRRRGGYIVWGRKVVDE